MHHVLQVQLVPLAVGLTARRAHGLAFGGVEPAELNAGTVRGQTHFAAQGVDFLDELALADTADGRITAHLPDRVEK